MFRQSENRTLNLRIVTAFAMLLAAIPVGALGATSLFTNRGEFEAAAPRPLLLETCEDDPVGALSVPATLLGSGLIVDTDPRAVTTEITTSESYSFNTTPGGEKHLRFRYRQDYTATVLAPGYPIFGFGFDLSGFQDHLGRGGFDVVLSRDQHVVDSFKVPDPGDFGPNFHGIVSGAPFDAVSLTLLDGDYVGLDDISCDVPEPGTLGLLAMGGVALLLLSGSVSLSRKGRLMRSFVVGLVALVVLIGFGTVDGAVLTVYTDRPGWEAAVSSFVTEDFNSLSNTPPFSAGLTHVGLIDIEIVGHPHNNRIDDGTATSFYTDGTRFVVGTAAGTQHSLPGLPSIVFPSPVYGFAALWDSTHTLARLTTQMGTEVVHFDDYLPGSGDGFLGVVSDAAFNRADFDVEDQGSLEGFAFDNLSFAAIPEPRTLILLATGALGLLACGWRRKRR